ncbi:hypothetical protein ACFO5R_13790 [Halosolutus amylolyticus]|uniref:Uncharacterized protein n=1 Tax=Halosolutus amylolyticus TaxID=2932267 RepID=A0ABD5PR14_9EURY|nr:hypothetical protein [Halosolutus amylolyticus]
MGIRTDAGLAVLALAAFLGAFVVADADYSIRFLLLGAAGTVAFELVAFRRTDAVRRVWERRSVQTASLVGALLLAIGGALFAPSRVLSAGIGTLIAYLIVLGLVVARRQW